MEDKNYLIKLLLDKNVDLETRDGYAMDLADHDGDDVLQALHQCASDSSEKEIIQGSCGESLAIIMLRNSRLSKRYIAGLSKRAYFEFKLYITAVKPDWIPEIESTYA